MVAAMNGHKDTILMLIQRGANLNLVDQVSMYLFVFTTPSLKDINITGYTIVMKAEEIFKNMKNSECQNLNITHVLI